MFGKVDCLLFSPVVWTALDALGKIYITEEIMSQQVNKDPTHLEHPLHGVLPCIFLLPEILGLIKQVGGGCFLARGTWPFALRL